MEIFYRHSYSSRKGRNLIINSLSFSSNNFIVNNKGVEKQYYSSFTNTNGKDKLSNSWEQYENKKYGLIQILPG